MSEFWSKVYKSDNSFFGDDPSNFAIRCYNHLKENNSKKILDLGSGHGRDALFFASVGIEVDSLNYSATAIEILDKMAKEKRLPIKAKVFDVNNQLPFSRCYFDAIYSHMLLNMRFSLHELHSIFSEIR